MHLTYYPLRLQGNDIFAEQVKEEPPKNLAFSESKLNELSGSDIFGDAQQVYLLKMNTIVSL